MTTHAATPSTPSTTDYAVRIGAAIGRQYALMGALREVALLRGIVSAGGTVTDERLTAMYDVLTADYEAASAEQTALEAGMRD